MNDEWFVPVLWSYATIAALGIAGGLVSLAHWQLSKWRNRRKEQERAEILAQQAIDELAESIPLDEICLEPMKIEAFSGEYVEMYAGLLSLFERTSK